MKLLYEGKAKRLFDTGHAHELLMEFKNDATAFNGKKKAAFEDKGRLNKALSLHLLRLLENSGIATHLIADHDETHLLVKSVEIILIEVVVRNIACGSLCKRTGLPEGQVLKQPIVEFYYKNDALGDPMINQDHVRELGLATQDELARVKASALEVNGILAAFFLKAGMRLVDFKLEFGRLTVDPATIVLADEITPDTCRLWDVKTGEILDKDRFRRDLGKVMESYAEVLKRVEHVVQS